MLSLCFGLFLTPYHPHSSVRCYCQMLKADSTLHFLCSFVSENHLAVVRIGFEPISPALQLGPLFCLMCVRVGIPHQGLVCAFHHLTMCLSFQAVNQCTFQTLVWMTASIARMLYLQVVVVLDFCVVRTGLEPVTASGMGSLTAIRLLPSGFSYLP